MPRRRLLLTVSTLVAVALAVTGCTIPTTKDGGGYGPSNQTARKAAQPAPVDRLPRGLQVALAHQGVDEEGPGGGHAAPPAGGRHLERRAGLGLRICEPPASVSDR